MVMVCTPDKGSIPAWDAILVIPIIVSVAFVAVVLLLTAPALGQRCHASRPWANAALGASR